MCKKSHAGFDSRFLIGTPGPGACIWLGYRIARYELVTKTVSSRRGLVRLKSCSLLSACCRERMGVPVFPSNPVFRSFLGCADVPSRTVLLPGDLAPQCCWFYCPTWSQAMSPQLHKATGRGRLPDVPLQQLKSVATADPLEFRSMAGQKLCAREHLLLISHVAPSVFKIIAYNFTYLN
jgi:hypothetical protein